MLASTPARMLTVHHGQGRVQLFRPPTCACMKAQGRICAQVDRSSLSRHDALARSASAHLGLGTALHMGARVQYVWATPPVRDMGVLG